MPQLPSARKALSVDEKNELDRLELILCGDRGFLELTDDERKRVEILRVKKHQYESEQAPWARSLIWLAEAEHRYESDELEAANAAARLATAFATLHHALHP